MMLKVPEASPDKIRLFIAYSRFEFALKECGYVTKTPGIAYADWHRFAKQASLRDVLKTAAKNGDVQELILRPPQLQVTDGGGYWHWEAGPPITGLKEFFEAVKQVRDNLFHGGKAGEEPRDDRLCRAALEVLRLCLARDPDVNAMFEGRY